MKLTMWRVVVVLNMYTKFRENSLLHLSFNEIIFPETCLQIKDKTTRQMVSFTKSAWVTCMCFNQMATIL